jgi:hypothetical protein
VLSFSKETREFEWESAELLEYSVENEVLLEIEFQDGRRINLSREHPLLKTTASNDQQLCVWEEAKNLKEEDLKEEHLKAKRCVNVIKYN